MTDGSPGRELDEAERLRHEYETSLSWRLTRPVRAVGRVARALRPDGRPDVTPGAPAHDRVDDWLEQFYGDALGAIDARCAEGGSDERYALFRELHDDLWALLLTQQYDRYPHIRALLPTVPEAGLQTLWNGTSGLALASQSKSFYARLRALYERYGDRPLAESSVLDFGCGWGRLTRFLLRDVAPGNLYGCDPAAGIVELCRASGIAATFATSESTAERVPFDRRFDLTFAFSVFTHLPEDEHIAALLALHRSLRPGGLLVVTIRPPDYLSRCAAMRPVLESLGPDRGVALSSPRYLFVAHPDDPWHPQAEQDGTVRYGETVITMAYVRDRWSEWFELLDADVQLEDLHQVILALRAR